MIKPSYSTLLSVPLVLSHHIPYFALKLSIIVSKKIYYQIVNKLNSFDLKSVCFV